MAFSGENTTFSNQLYSNEIFREYSLQIGASLIWKNDQLAQSLEIADPQEAYRSELFIMACRGLLSWDIIAQFPKVVLQNAGVSPDKIITYSADKNKIPTGDRQACVNEYARALTSKNPLTGHYEYYDSTNARWVDIVGEKNDYYRMLMGLPNYGTASYIYNTDPRWSTTTPIHNMDLVSRYEMEQAGVLDDLIKANPDADYLKFVGSKSIDLYRARVAERYDILWMDETDSTVFNKDFRDTYAACRYMATNIYYNKGMENRNELYDNFMALSIFFMTISSMQQRYLRADISRDFYDVESFKIIYDSYGVPFYREIPLEYHDKIIKNMNKLIGNKGSSQVFFDLFRLFDYGDMVLNQYYIVKRHRLDENGNPIFITKTDSDGNTLYDEDGRPMLSESSYELQFSKAGIYEDPALAVADPNNDIDYTMMTIKDPYWISDEALLNKLNSEEFNYLESKYIGVQTVIDLMKVSFENAYIFRMISDNEELTSAIALNLSEIGVNCSLFDLFIYLAALYCRVHNYQAILNEAIPSTEEANWSTTPVSMAFPIDESGLPTFMDTIGYNFENAREVINEAVAKYPTTLSNIGLQEIASSISVNTSQDVSDSYTKIIQIKDLIIQGYQNAKTREEFYAYRDLYNSLLISKACRDTYVNPETGELFETFKDVLAYHSPDLMTRYLTLSDSDIETEMNIITTVLEKTVTTMRYLPFSAGLASNQVIEMLFRILGFFKSAKAELLGYEIIYSISARGVNFIKFIDELRSFYTEGEDSEEAFFIDLINYIRSEQKLGIDLIRLEEKYSDLHFSALFKDIHQLVDDEIRGLVNSFPQVKDEIWEIDNLHSVHETTKFEDSQSFGDRNNLELTGFRLARIETLATVKDKGNTQMSDKLYEINQETNELIEV